MVDPKIFHGRSKENPLSVEKKLQVYIIDPEKIIVDPDPASNYAIPDSAIPSNLPLTLPGQVK